MQTKAPNVLEISSRKIIVFLLCEVQKGLRDGYSKRCRYNPPRFFKGVGALGLATTVWDKRKKQGRLILTKLR
ncbi:hypothetical protein KSC_110520 [Ktedonobacter sp. SOSP1-52]|uniref:hypothetical protein n=1 Tax=Ktedonobacter sp. SOSP1-52 TaxID=2778366 RepID=UPI001915B0CC|nr:hypothetical protein [Ktedonobacter sp. SOSP1-52]GHO72160.1 hypothetical protein KSC_110520 [Ktedonobacter sp. SOSP1-52]